MLAFNYIFTAIQINSSKARTLVLDRVKFIYILKLNLKYQDIIKVFYEYKCLCCLKGGI